MPKVTVLHNQTLLDIAIQESGSADNWLEIAMLNNLTPTDLIIPGASIEIPTDITINTGIVNFLSTKGTKTATANTDTTIEPTLQLSCQQKIEQYFITGC